ncbi:calcium-binding protein [Actinoplanes oblitus]|uniref:Calcium-binding protein n=1 Tax=Actinoplanes oblitus TaxID=3040509 RepID=A0ABY8WIG5_9ACTN|nr:calcium-binding protein [Actinoplanes oblitus]WIM96283.1 calcium-binding protein [Actinoplanes oblitus]
MARSPWFYRAGATLIAGAAVLTAASPAQAASTGTASASGTVIKFTARPGKANNVVVTRSGRTVTIDDKYAIKPGKGCKRVDSTKVRCTTEEPTTALWVYLGTKSDRFVNKTSIRSDVSGGSGNDVITGGSDHDIIHGDTGNDVINGGYGTDEIYAEGGNDRVDGGSGKDWLDGGTGNDKVYGGTYGDYVQGGLGNDLVDGGSGNDYLAGENEDRGLAGSYPVGADIFRGGTGRDTVSYEFHGLPVTVDLDGATRDDGQAGEHDTVGTDVENIDGSPLNDTLIGNAGDNVLWGNRGNDTIRGGAGNDSIVGFYGVDKLYGEAGDDTLDAVEPLDPQEADRVDGGKNASALGDLCKSTAADVVTACER